MDLALPGFLMAHTPLGGGVPEYIIIVPCGTVELFGDEPIVMDQVAAEAVIASFQDRGVEIPVDYEHSTLYQAGQGKRSPAAGWVKSLQWVEGQGLVGHVEWSDQANADIAGKRYKYLSPHLKIDTETRRVEHVLAVALTNTPRINNMRELVAASIAAGEFTMPKDKKKTLLERVASAVNLEGTADEDVVVAAVEEAVAQTDPNAPPQDQGAGGPDQAVMDLMNELRSQLMQMGVVGADVTLADALQAAIDYLGQTDTSGGSSQATGSIAEALSLAKTATAKDIIAAINAQRTTTVPSAELKDAKDRIAKLEDERDTKRAQELVASVIEAGKINPNSEKSLDWARKFAKRDPDEFVAHFADAPVLYSSEQQTPTEANVNKRDSAIVAAIREYGEQMVTCSVKSYVNAALDSDGLEHLTDDEAKKHNI